MTWYTFFFAILPIAALGQTARPEIVGPLISNLEAGIICAQPTTGENPAPGTVAGSTHLIEVDPPFVSSKRKVPAVIGMGFGVKVRTNDPEGIPVVTMTITHPEMGALGTTTQIFQTLISGTEKSLTFYQFDFDYELVAGTWHLEASQGGSLLYRQTFEVVPPAEVPELAGICGYEELLS